MANDNNDNNDGFENDGFEPRSPAEDSIWFLIEPAVPPFPCTKEEGKMWYRMEHEMWEFFVMRSLTDEVEPLFPGLYGRGISLN